MSASYEVPGLPHIPRGPEIASRLGTITADVTACLPAHSFIARAGYTLFEPQPRNNNLDYRPVYSLEVQSTSPPPGHTGKRNAGTLITRQGKKVDKILNVIGDNVFAGAKTESGDRHRTFVQPEGQHQVATDVMVTLLPPPVNPPLEFPERLQRVLNFLQKVDLPVTHVDVTQPRADLPGCSVTAAYNGGFEPQLETVFDWLLPAAPVINRDRLLMGFQFYATDTVAPASAGMFNIRYRSPLQAMLLIASMISKTNKRIKERAKQQPQ